MFLLLAWPPRLRWVVCRSDMHAIYLGGPFEGQLKVHLLTTDRHHFVVWKVWLVSLPMGSMYSIFTYIYHNNQQNVGKYYHTWILWDGDSWYWLTWELIRSTFEAFITFSVFPLKDVEIFHCCCWKGFATGPAEQMFSDGNLCVCVMTPLPNRFPLQSVANMCLRVCIPSATAKLFASLLPVFREGLSPLWKQPLSSFGFPCCVYVVYVWINIYICIYHWNPFVRIFCSEVFRVHGYRKIRVYTYTHGIHVWYIYLHLP